jgi:hypothetical protein
VFDACAAEELELFCTITGLAPGLLTMIWIATLTGFDWVALACATAPWAVWLACWVAWLAC